MMTSAIADLNVAPKAHSSKRAKQIKQLLKLVDELNNDIYICIKDKKTHKVHQFSSDLAHFGNRDISKLAA